ncbi:MAG: S8 family peptidase [Anaerolineales bacterium]
MKKITLYKSLTFLLTLMVVVGLSGSAAPSLPVSALKAQPILAQMASTDPDQIVRVIVQKAAAAQDAEAQVAARGGKVIRDLSIINAFAAEMNAHAALQLASHPSVRWVSLDASMIKSGGPDGTVNTKRLLNAYIKSIGADRLWAEGYQGSSVTVAVVDSGITDQEDFKEQYGGNGDLRIRATATFVEGSDKNKDWYGHGTHVAGIIAGNGTKSYGRYTGVAPKANLVSVDIANEQGAATMADVIAGMEWILENQTAYNIRVVNISLNSSVPEPYHTSPLDAACEILWFNGIVVVVSAGNNGTATLYPPANDPFVITVGAVDDMGTASIRTDPIAGFSAFGIDEAGQTKPDLVAPGRNIISTLAKQDAVIAIQHPDRKVFTFSGSQDYYFRMSGTSMAAPVVSGAIALLLQDEPDLTPDQVKYRLMATANKTWLGYKAEKAGAGYLDIYAAVNGTTTDSANTGLMASQLLWSGSESIARGSVNWNSVNWNSVNWNSVNWNSVNWNSVNWNSVNWNSVNWNSDYWGP